MSYESKKMWAQYLRQIKECEEKIERYEKDARMHCWWSKFGRPAGENAPEYKLYENYVAEGKYRWYPVEVPRTEYSEERWAELIKRDFIIKVVTVSYESSEYGDTEIWDGNEDDCPTDMEDLYYNSHANDGEEYDPKRLYTGEFYILNLPDWREPPVVA